MSQAVRGSIRFIERFRARHEPDIILPQNGVLSLVKWKVQAILFAFCVLMYLIAFALNDAAETFRYMPPGPYKFIVHDVEINPNS